MTADREASAVRLLQLERLIAKVPGGYQVQSERDPSRVYLVSIETGRCSCPDFQYRLAGGELGECKHILAVRMCYGSDA